MYTMLNKQASSEQEVYRNNMLLTHADVKFKILAITGNKLEGSDDTEEQCNLIKLLLLSEIPGLKGWLKRKKIIPPKSSK